MGDATRHRKTKNEAFRETWLNTRWRPMMGWVYMATCVTDFILFPVLWAIIHAVTKQPLTQWIPITLQGAGLFHLSMGAILGVAAWGRTQEKIAGIDSSLPIIPINPGGVIPPIPPIRPYYGPTVETTTTVETPWPPTSKPQVDIGYKGKPKPIQPPDSVL